MHAPLLRMSSPNHDASLLVMRHCVSNSPLTLLHACYYAMNVSIYKVHFMYLHMLHVSNVHYCTSFLDETYFMEHEV